MSGSWGTELWDKYPDLTSHIQNGIDFLENSVASFIRERGKIEAEYAKSLRTLVKRYAPREVVKSPDDEYTHIKGFKQVRSIRLRLRLPYVGLFIIFCYVLNFASFRSN
jgi:hypothetical protein